MTTAVETFQQGGVIAYPTEAVFGLGCDPDNQSAVERILQIKNRPVEKGLILLAGNYSQLLPYIDDNAIPQDKRFTVLSRWPDGVTQVLPARPSTPKYLTGKFTSLAVRVTSQPDVVALCRQTGKPVVSTSANLSGQSPALTWQEVECTLASSVDYIIKGDTLGFDKPSTIIDALTGETFRS
ncbi:L-threonylcarbamoyladenylate synthase [Thalassotalea sp. 1_MG-2023]|uniref:L-threonylcarbamoyladenylate synthase n=1 Tax=Thalassotalea sp. 1_MG-2023 TaxID=3062680 RepID=UPI0026E2F6D4|nr:L-threonylcarbamoyladenylate synthase [Thalassotalea sp. 1_MG-2023]MDO6427616.1 L-threonylcarbamoyladenylate synthase [Thalassotalea sp. 1_MG-2023]